ncbi:rhamnolipids biosynthesis 3-oxoacyl-reductase [Laetiporus sulphureus 93-53]|uniref:Rhamnolipids biosynthesis 3-oxoacyl-reductase n=1 Tax=Laetiporus sulphureus 93-53 TaxID=1314785 RepID=A0A165F0P8_9APHY|nr:rhamnolipids biosynthesis 3-oxoacyl-reductase [Laetiporus sulphureus 93-53]KZT08120.1 rhamnolipids biosynthesis 3-oxoacyl-reductase [Laetiporus sulphureus 93-53]
MSDDLTIPSLFDVQGKVVVITGGGIGIGTMIASAFVQNGAKVYIAARKEAQLKSTAETLNKRGPGSCHYFVADLSTKAGCEALAASIKAREPKIHVLVNNSGTTWGAPYDNFPEIGWDRTLALNVKSIFYLTVALTDALEAAGSQADPARVINISSIAGLTSSPWDNRVSIEGVGLWSYNTSKAAVNHLTTQLATTLLPKHITVNAILPGIFPSNMTKFGLKKHGADSVALQNPMGRLGTPRDMAGVALFLASPAASYVTGAHIVLDGGDLISLQIPRPSDKAAAKL